METLEIAKSDYEVERGKPMPTHNHAVLQRRILLRIVQERDEQVAAELPLIAIEITSPSQSNAEMRAKAERYLQAGVKSCCIVLPE